MHSPVASVLLRWSIVNRRELQDLARIRLAEAKALLSAGFSDGAYYLAGYAVECGLKACIAKGVRRYDFPDKKSVDASYTHNLKDLVRVADLELIRLDRARQDSVFRNNWDLVQRWSEHSRYQRCENGMATALVEAVGNIKYGVLPWIRQHW